MNELILDGVPITVEKKRIKNMYLRVLPPDGRVLLTAPKAMPNAAIERFARARLPWVQKHRAQLSRAAAPSMRYESGETVLLWGVARPLTFIPSAGRAHAMLAETGVRLFAAADSTPEKRAALLDSLYREQLAVAAAAALPGLERLIGKRASALRIRDMKTRWGTCNTATAAITLNLQLARRAPEYLDYVLAHELTHLHEPSHNARFYALMDRFYPDWKQVRKRLKTGEP